MHAKIVLLPGSPVGERLCGIAEEVLTDVSVAFGHTFSIVRDKIGEAAMRAYGVPLSENTPFRTIFAANSSTLSPGIIVTFRTSGLPSPMVSCSAISVMLMLRVSRYWPICSFWPMPAKSQ